MVESDIFSSVRVIVLISKVWGLIFYSGHYSSVMRIFYFLYSSAATIFYAYICVTYNLHSYSLIEQAPSDSKLLAKIIYVRTSLKCLLVLSILTVNLFKSRQFVKLLTKLGDFDALMSRKLRKPVPPSDANTKLQTGCVCWILATTVYNGVQFYVEGNGTRLSIMWSIVCTINVIVMCQLIVFVHIFYVRFRLFNDFLRSDLTFVPSLPIAIGIGSSTAINLFFGHPNNNYRFKNAYLLNQFRLKELNVMYLNLRDLLGNANAYYSLQILLIVCETVIVLIASISTITFDSLNDQTIASTTVHRNLTLIHCVLKLLNIAVLVHFAERTSHEANSTVVIIHHFLKTEHNVEVKKGLEIFLLDLWYHKVKFNANDFFDLDYDLIQSILSAATTYVVVLIQFQLATTTIPKPVTKEVSTEATKN